MVEGKAQRLTRLLSLLPLLLFPVLPNGESAVEGAGKQSWNTTKFYIAVGPVGQFIDLLWASVSPSQKMGIASDLSTREIEVAWIIWNNKYESRLSSSCMCTQGGACCRHEWGWGTQGIEEQARGPSPEMEKNRT